MDKLRTEHLYKKYGKRTVVNDVSIYLEQGEIVGLLGPNGAGKTTLTKLIMRLYDASSGQILYNGKDIKNYNIKQLRERFAAVFQDYRIFAATIKENVIGGESASETDNIAVENALKNSTFTDKLNALTDGIETVLTREFDNSGTQLSGGERQKVSLARCYCQNAKILLLDEPSSFLDVQSKKTFLDQMKKLEQEDFSVIAVTHDEEIIKELNWKTVRFFEKEKSEE